MITDDPSEIAKMTTDKNFMNGVRFCDLAIGTIFSFGPETAPLIKVSDNEFVNLLWIHRPNRVQDISQEDFLSVVYNIDRSCNFN